PRGRRGGGALVRADREPPVHVERERPPLRRVALPRRVALSQGVVLSRRVALAGCAALPQGVALSRRVVLSRRVALAGRAALFGDGGVAEVGRASCRETADKSAACVARGRE